MKEKKYTSKNADFMFEKIMYWISCITTLGSIWILKIVIKKAIVEAEQLKK
jgi:hypothetical protein